MNFLKTAIELFCWFMVFRAFILIIEFSKGFNYEFPSIVVEDKEDEKESEE